MITGEQGAGKLACPVREGADGKGPGDRDLAGGLLHSEGGARKRTASEDPYRASLRPYFNLLEPHVEVVLANAAHVKAVPGRKTDVRDSEWLLDLMQHGLIRGGFIPEAPIRALRDLTRYRTNVIEERTRALNRIQKVLEDTNIKLCSIFWSGVWLILGAAGQAA